jgi:hypothetical protein
MKFKYLLTALVAGLALLTVGCTEDDNDIKVLDELQVSSSFVSIAQTGGSSTITVTATDSWAFTESTIPSWLTVSPKSGNAGETTVTFTAPATLTGKGTVELQITCAGKTQHVNVIQGLKKAEASTCAQVTAGADGKTYRVTGTCTSIANTIYGNWYLADASGSVYIYGTLDKNGAEKNFASLGLEEGDVVTVEGPKSTYGTTVELVNVTVVSIVKSLVKVNTAALTLPKADTTFTLDVTCKGNGLSVVIPDAAKSWLHVSSIVTSGTNAQVTMFADANTAMAPRTAAVGFSSSSSSQTSSVTYTVTQKGNLPDPVNIGTITNKVTYACVTGKITAISKQAYIVTDATGSIQVYYGSKFVPANYTIGKTVTVAGAVSVYNFALEISGIDYEAISSGKFTYPTATVLDAAAMNALVAATSGKVKTVDAVCPIKYVQVTGTLAVSGSYYNLNVDGTTTAVGSLSQPLDSFGLADMSGANVTVKGYTTSISGGKYVNIIVTSATKN